MKLGVALKDAIRRLLSKPFTIGYPVKDEVVAVPRGYRGALAYDREACIGCMLCVKVCPSGAISIAEDRKLVFDLGRCVFCGQCVEVCPRKAIKLTEIFELVTEDRGKLLRGSGNRESSGERQL